VARDYSKDEDPETERVHCELIKWDHEHAEENDPCAGDFFWIGVALYFRFFGDEPPNEDEVALLLRLFTWAMSRYRFPLLMCESLYRGALEISIIDHNQYVGRRRNEAGHLRALH
jgi:hypothetical protein